MDFELSSLFDWGMTKKYTKEYRYLAQDKSGFWYLYQGIPKHYEGKWSAINHIQVGWSVGLKPDYNTKYYDLGEIDGF